MTRNTPWRAYALVSLQMFVTGRASAWESACTELTSSASRTEQSCTLWDLAKTPWRSTTQRDEHRALFERAMIELALPSEMLEAFELAVYAVDRFRLPPIPAPWSRVEKIVSVQRTVAEFAQLPDYGYSLSDYATAFKTCPPNADVEADECHDYLGHLGGLNSTHFPPQSQRAHAHYHELAKLRAAACAALSARLEGQARFDAYVVECKREALILEAIAQHFLSDAWSVGHMWERWGSPRLTDFPGGTEGERLHRAKLVGAVTGFIHGSEPLLGFPDPMCTPDDAVTFRWREGEHQGAGDLYWRTVSRESRYDAQWGGLMECSTESLGEVWQIANGEAPSSSMADDCFSQRATNRAMWAGLEMWRMTPALIHVVVNGARMKYRTLADQLQSLATVTKSASDDDPHGVTIASGGMPAFLGVQANSRYPDPPDYWDTQRHLTRTESEAGELEVTAAVPRLFHRAHAADWCSVVTVDELYALRERALARALREPSTASASAEVALCAEMARRHLHVGAKDATGAAAGAPATCALAQGATIAPAVGQQAPLCAVLVRDAAKVGLLTERDRLDAPIEEHALAWCLQPACDPCEAACTYRSDVLGCAAGAAGSCVSVCRTVYLLASQQGACSDQATALEDCHYSAAALALGCTLSDARSDQAVCAQPAGAFRECKAIRDRINPVPPDAGAPIVGDTPEAYCEAACGFKVDDLGCADPVGSCVPLCVAAHSVAAQRGACATPALALEACRYSKPALLLGCTASEAVRDASACASEKAAFAACQMR